MDLNQKKFFDKIQRDYQKFSQDVVDIEVIYARHSTVCDVKTQADSFIFKFPLSENNYDIKREGAILNALHSKIDIDIPKVTHEGISSSYIGYKKINKPNLTVEKLKNTTTKEYQAIFHQLACFLYSINSNKDHVLKKIDIPLSPTQSYPQNILSAIESDLIERKLVSFSEKVISEFHDLGQADEDQFIYNDLHLGNILMDDNYSISIIDFGFCSIGDTHREFHQFHKYNEKWLNCLIDAYENISRLNFDKRRVELLSKIDQLNYYFSLLLSLKKTNEDSDQYIQNVKSYIDDWINQ